MLHGSYLELRMFPSDEDVGDVKFVLLVAQLAHQSLIVRLLQMLFVGVLVSAIPLSVQRDNTAL